MDGLNIKITVKISKYILLTLLLIGCQKEDISIDPEPELCYVDYNTLHQGVNKKTSHFQPHNVPFVDYASYLETALSPFGSLTIVHAFGNFNNNDRADLIVTSNDWENSSSNELAIVKDGVVAHRFTNPQVFTRKISIADLNNDGIDDVVLFGTGPDVGNSSGDNIIIIYIYSNSYLIKELTDKPGYYHTGIVGDLTGDGNYEIMGINSQAFTSGAGYAQYYKLEDGEWNAYDTNIEHHYYARLFQSELVDIDADGILDLILGGHEWEEQWMSNALSRVEWRTHIIKGLGGGQFDIDNTIFIPSITDWGVITNFNVEDINNDGELEIIITRTTGNAFYATQGPVLENYYDGIKIQIGKLSGNHFVSLTTLNQPSIIYNDPQMHIIWALNTKVYDVNLDCLLDIIPESDKINSNSYLNTLPIRGMYYEQQTDGTFNINYN